MQTNDIDLRCRIKLTNNTKLHHYGFSANEVKLFIAFKLERASVVLQKYEINNANY
jgi:hypothetical protein